MNCVPSSADPAFSLVERLESLPYFRAADPARIASLAGQAICRTFAAQAMIIAQDAPSAGLWIIEAGQVKISRLSADGREHILHLFGPGDSFNDIPAIDGGTNPANAVAISRVTAWTLPSDVLLAALRDDPDLALAAIAIIANRTRMLVQQIDDLALCSVPARLARFLLKEMEHSTFDGPGVTRATIAAHLATTPETVSRALRMLEDIGAIQFNRQQIVVTRPDLLRSVAME